MPNIHISFLAIIIAVVAHFILGFIWYTPLFGKVWAKENGFDTTKEPPKGSLVKGMLLNLVGNFLMAWVFAHNLAVWNPATWGLPVPAEMTPVGMAFAGAIFTWLGFFVPITLNSVAWEMKSWKLFFINTAYHLLSLIVVAQILVNMA